MYKCELSTLVNQLASTPLTTIPTSSHHYLHLYHHNLIINMVISIIMVTINITIIINIIIFISSLKILCQGINTSMDTEITAVLV